MVVGGREGKAGGRWHWGKGAGGRWGWGDRHMPGRKLPQGQACCPCLSLSPSHWLLSPPVLLVLPLLLQSLQKGGGGGTRHGKSACKARAGMAAKVGAGVGVGGGKGATAHHTTTVPVPVPPPCLQVPPVHLSCYIIHIQTGRGREGGINAKEGRVRDQRVCVWGKSAGHKRTNKKGVWWGQIYKKGMQVVHGGTKGERERERERSRFILTESKKETRHGAGENPSLSLSCPCKMQHGCPLRE